MTYLFSRFHFSIVQGKDIRTGAGEGGQVSNSFWVYEVGRGRWSVVYRNENSEADYWQRRQTREPRPRYAHQLVYHEEAGTHFMFGGNPGGKVSSGSLTSSRRCSVIRITVPNKILTSFSTPGKSQWKAAVGRLLEVGAAAAAEHGPGAAPGEGDQEDSVPGEVLRPHGGSLLPPDQRVQLHQPSGSWGAEGVSDAGWPALPSG